ncbi:MAG TPA: radical SAM protein, partial [Spirochaetota bacterium]|nr:radical SAM protein [Spirochaetota bacterium]
SKKSFLTFNTRPVTISFSMRVIIFSLPIPEIYNKYNRGNHQIFAEYMQSIVKKENISDIEIIKLNRDIVDRYNNNKIVEEIINLKPDIVCLSSYVWNIERNIAISKLLRENDIITITGGPEIQLDNEYLFKKDPFDIYVIGEGEKALLHLLRNIKENNNKIIYGNSVNFNEFLLQYSEITDQYKYDKLFYIEVERGCNFKCNYCVYGKTRDFLTKIDEQIFKSIIEKFYNKKEIEEIYLLSPTLNHNKLFFKNILENLISLKEKSKSDIQIFGELRPELLTKGDIPLLKKAGFKTIEIGIQSFNKEAIANINRNSNKFQLKDLAYLLLENGIDLIIDFIIGLPGETFNSMIETIQLLDKYNLLHYCNFYRLQILHSTELKRIFNNNGFKYQKEPPYFVINTDNLCFNNISDIYLYLEQNKDYSYNEDFIIKEKEQFFVINNQNDMDYFIQNNYFYHSGSLIFLDNFDFEKIYKLFDNFFYKNPEIFHHCYIYSRKKISKKDITRLKKLFYSYPNYYDRYNEATNFLKDPLSKRLTILVDSSFDNEYIDSLYDDFTIDFIIFNENQLKDIVDIAITFDMNIFEFKENMLYLKNIET